MAGSCIEEEALVNGIASMLPPSLHTDDDDDDSGPEPSELYGKYTWKIYKFSHIKRGQLLRSNAFRNGGYEWCILMYPHGTDDSNDHMSLFLCVANHENLPTAWSQLTQFTMYVVNKDPKKSKYSDTLHRFRKEEHNWGWKKYMKSLELLNGFLDDDTLTIKAQIQVIRERADRPFRCLDSHYKGELIRVYLSNVDEHFSSFVEEKRGRFKELTEDKIRWSSFCSFWRGIDEDSRQQMLREESDLILKEVVNHFLIEDEVLSTLKMESLYSGLRALEVNGKFVGMEKDSFILVDDVLVLLEMAALESLIPKYEKDLIKDSVEPDERRFIELGCRTIEIFVLSHIFSKVEVIYQEARGTHTRSTGMHHVQKFRTRSYLIVKMIL